MTRNALLAALEDPNRAWLIFLLGIVLIYRELTRPGRILPGMAGAIAIFASVYSIFRNPWSPAALAAIVVGMLLLVSQGFRTWHWIPGVAGALLITAGVHRLTEPRILLLLAACAIPMSGITVFLLRTAILARRKKLSVE